MRWAVVSDLGRLVDRDSFPVIPQTSKASGVKYCGFGRDSWWETSKSASRGERSTSGVSWSRPWKNRPSLNRAQNELRLRVVILDGLDACLGKWWTVQGLWSGRC